MSNIELPPLPDVGRLWQQAATTTTWKLAFQAYARAAVELNCKARDAEIADLVTERDELRKDVARLQRCVDWDTRDKGRL